MEPEASGLVFVIDGKDYAAPDLTTLDMDERNVLYDLSGIVQEDFARGEDETEEDFDARVSRMTRPPGFVHALMLIAYWRGNPRLTIEKAKAVVGKTNFLEAVKKWTEEQEDSSDVVPLPVTNEPEPPSQNEQHVSSGSSGSGSTNGSGEQDEIRSPIGTMRSGTSPTLALRKSVG